MASNFNLLGIIGLVGAILMVVGVFLEWVDYGVLGSASGWDVFNNWGDTEVKYTYVPLVSLICGIISLVLMIVPTFMNVDKFQKINNILGIVALILSLVVVVCGLLFYLQSWGSGLVTISLSNYIQFGFWIVLVGGIITLVGGLMPIVKNKFM